MNPNVVVGGGGLSKSQLEAMGIQVDIGHKEHYEFNRARNAAESLGWSQPQFNDFMNDKPTEKYQYETHERNISHQYEDKSKDLTNLTEEMTAYQKEREEAGDWERRNITDDADNVGGCDKE